VVSLSIKPDGADGAAQPMQYTISAGSAQQPRMTLSTLDRRRVVAPCMLTDQKAVQNFGWSRISAGFGKRAGFWPEPNSGTSVTIGREKHFL